MLTGIHFRFGKLEKKAMRLRRSNSKYPQMNQIPYSGRSYKTHLCGRVQLQMQMLSHSRRDLGHTALS